ncbi:YfhO family protein [Draconibacterium halophilum]|uniref:YfhO family protein n=1 Tax=Draconibacterium halophilum TaxID=2706887 RepID=A0A6C0R8R9_9BACT|nr:YfhO family protein [Draconibacterium halophilum]QIA06710.1 YfhO family protein [Draconibacterium halophilum]
MKKKWFNYIIPIVLLFITTSIYFLPVYEGKVVQQSDIMHYKGMSKSMADFRKESGEEPLWTDAMFSGMPGYLISTVFKGNITKKIIGFVLKIPRPVSYHLLFLSLFYLMCIILGVNPWLSLAGALAYGFTSFFFVVFEAGHTSKSLTITYISLLIAGVFLAYKNKRLAGALLSTLSLSWMIAANHLQMTYYAGIMILIIVIVYFIYALREKAIIPFLKSSGILATAAILAIGMNISTLWPIYEYSKESIRGKSELTSDLHKKSDGLDRDYILDYSYDVGEALTAFIPRLKGGSMAEPLGEKSQVYELLARGQNKQNAMRIANNLPLYWGSQPIAGGPFYFGAVLCFLFVFGLFIVKGKDKWWIVATVVVSFALSLGKYFPALSNLMIDYFPLYNKFRDVKNIIIIQQFAMAFMGVMAVSKVYKREVSDKVFNKALLYSFAIAGGLALVFTVIPGLAGDFTAASDARLLQAGWPEQLLDALQADRKIVVRTDAFRTFIFVALAAGVLWAFWKKKIKAEYALALWIVLIMADMWPTNKRYLNNDSFVAKRKMNNPYTLSEADKLIHQDDALSYRVLNLTVNPFTDASTSYFHKSIGGYHAAKLKRYQELIEYHISPEIQKISRTLNSGLAPDKFGNLFNTTPALKMLNTKYLIVNPNGAPVQDPATLGNAWFVNNYEIVENADAEIDALAGLNPANKAIIDKRYEQDVSGKTYQKSGSIQLEVSDPNYLKYNFSSDSEQLTVFSEIFYDKGWDAYIDGEKAPYFRANYVLRAMSIPAGDHTIEFKFEPQSYFLGTKLSYASSFVFILLVLAYLGITIKNNGGLLPKPKEHATKTQGKVAIL